ncbi:anti-sigma factor [Schaalia sp. ZJ405]|nr:anti-sigma factor [Schaalia sp. ZJ405]
MACEQVRRYLDMLVDCEECDERTLLIDRGVIDGPAQQVRELLREHCLTCPECTDRLVAERHLRSLVRRCYESETAPSGLRARIIQSVTSVRVIVE